MLVLGDESGLKYEEIIPLSIWMSGFGLAVVRCGVEHQWSASQWYWVGRRYSCNDCTGYALSIRRPNDLALVLSFPISFAAGLALTQGRGRFSRLLEAVGYFVIASAILATQSRGGLLAILAVSGVFGLYKIKSKLLLISLGGIALIALLAMAGISDRSSGGAAEDGIDESAKGRLYAWEAEFNMANTHPLTGVGLNNFTSNYFFYSPHWDGMNHAVHSTWFGVVAETGYVGLIVFVTLAVKLVVGMRRLVNALLPLYQRQQCSPVIFATAQSTLAGLAGFLV